MTEAQAPKKRKVLVAMDGSDHSNFTFQWYVDNIKHDGDYLLLVWNTDVHPATFGTVNLMTGDPDVISKAMHEQRSHADATVKLLEEKLATAKVDGKVLQMHEHRAGEAILKAATEGDVDLIIVGSRGLSTLRRTFLGSVSDYVLHHAHVPVIVCQMDTAHKH